VSLRSQIIVVEVWSEVVVVHSGLAPVQLGYVSVTFQPFLPGLVCCSLLLASVHLR